MKEVFLPQTDIDRWMDIADFPNEIWKDVIGFEDAFQVSNLGRIKRKAFNFNIFNGVNSFRKAHIVKPQLRVGGYYHVSLSYKGKVYTKLIHRLVAMAFIPNPCNLPRVNHKDENPSNNCIDNLEWCDQKYNSNYGTNGQRISSKLTNGLRSKAVEAALKAYPKETRDITGFVIDIGHPQYIRDLYIEGYHQAEKDLELGLEDIRTILNIENDILSECNSHKELVIETYPKGEDYYGEILKRFKEMKEK